MISVVSSLTVIFMISCSDAFIPQIIDKIETAVVSDKGSAYLNCTVALQETQKSLVSWSSTERLLSQGESMNEPIRLGPNGIPKFAVKFLRGRPGYVPFAYSASSDNIYVYQLVVRFASQQDMGSYVCSIEINGAPQAMWPQAIGTLIVQRAPQIKPNLKSQIIGQGKTLSLFCEAEGSPPLTISWTRADGKKLKITEDGLFPADGEQCEMENATTQVPVSGSLSVTRYRYQLLTVLAMCPSDRGIYRCHAQNNVGLSAEFDVRIEVEAKPNIRLAREQGAYGQAYDKNYEATLECIVKGYPDPDLTWHRIYDDNTTSPILYDNEKYDSEKIAGYGAVGSDVMEFFFTFTIRNIKKGDYGRYRCKASNAYGEVHSDVLLFSQELCQGPICPVLGVAYNYNSVSSSYPSAMVVLLQAFLVVFYI